MSVLATAAFLLTYVLLWGNLYYFQRDWRSACLSAAVLWASLLAAITEILSLFRLLTFAAVAAAWSTCFVIALVAWTKLIGNPRKFWNGLVLTTLPRAELLLLLGGWLIAAVLAVVAWVAPPGNYDSMTYHMPRVMHWIQDHSVAYYPTHILRQLYLNAGAEFVILHVQLLSGTDRFAPFVQWSSMMGSVVGVSLIARQLGVGSRGQVLASLTAFAIPMGILQATSTQTDYVSAFWLVCFVSAMLAWRADASPWHALLAGASLGLAALAKSTAYLYAPAFGLWLGLSALRAFRSRVAMGMVLAACAFLLLNLGTFIRDYQLFGNPLGVTVEPTYNSSLSNEMFSLRETASNVLRNAALEMQTPFPGLNAQLEGGILFLHERMGIDPNDPRTTSPGVRFEIPPTAFSDDSDGNFLHTVLILISIGILTFWSGRQKSELLSYAACLLFSFLFFCFYLKWQPWNSRLHLSLFVLSVPLVGAAGEFFASPAISRAVGAAVLLAALPWVFLNHTRPLLGDRSILLAPRVSLYFRAERLAEEPYVDAVQFLAKRSGGQCKQVGLYMGGNDLEYPFWVLLRRDIGNDVVLESVGVENISARTAANAPQFIPCAILSTRPAESNILIVQSRRYTSARTFDFVSVYLPK